MAATDKGLVLVTGTSSGIGEATVHSLVRAGFRVLAGVRRTADAERYRGVAGIEPVCLDLTRPADLARAAALVADRGGRLTGLVNNAGFNDNAPFEFSDEVIARDMMEVNVFGLFRLTRLLLPALRAGAEAGRATVAHVASVGGLMGLPWQGDDHASKFAVLGLSESLQHELHAQRIRVSVLLPGGTRTPFLGKTDSSLDAALQRLPADGRDRYGRGLEVRRARIADAAWFVRLVPPPVTHRVLRCERRGLLAPRVAGNGYRVFTDEDVERARAIRLVSAMGFSLNEIRALLAAWGRHRLTPAQQVTVWREKACELETRIDALRRARNYLRAKARWIERGGRGPKPALDGRSRGAGRAATTEER
jgi:NAD(P)-dependent dehydrogenase (short-subunit alcohol dehydrogenase family)